MGISNDLKRAETMKKRDQVKKVITAFSKKKKTQAMLGPSKEEIKKLMVMALEVTEEEKEPSVGEGDERSGRRNS
jgi:hypothetical protein